MGWIAIAAALLDRVGDPAAVLDRAGRIRLVNRPMERLLGKRQSELAGHSWASPHLSNSVWRLDAALKGEVTHVDCLVGTASGEERSLRVRVSPIGPRPDGVLVTAEASCPTLERPTFAGDLAYDISVLARDFGAIKALWTADPEIGARAHVGQRCFEVLHGRKEACPGCPASSRGRHERGARTAVIAPQGSANGFALVTSRPVDATTERVFTRRVTQKELGQLCAARIGHLATQAGLSPREREVLDGLAQGKSGADIGAQLGISVRTVKFHQGKVLEKLGADSRADLLRLLT